MLYASGNSNRGLWQAEGRGGERDGREVWEREDMGEPMADCCWCMTENHKILESNYPSIKKNFFKSNIWISVITFMKMSRDNYVNISFEQFAWNILISCFAFDAKNTQMFINSWITFLIHTCQRNTLLYTCNKVVCWSSQDHKAQSHHLNHLITC